MSFGGGFGSNNGGGFGGFGTNNNNTTSGSSLFGGTTATAGGFGGFGSNNAANNNNNPFGAAKSFGAANTSTGGSLFGGGTSTTGGFGASSGFGANNTTGGATLSTGFGNNNSSSTSLFGAKPATGAFGSTNTGGSLFGNSNNNAGGFGTNNASSAFGSGTNAGGFGSANNTTTSFGANNNNNNASSAFGGFSNTASTTQGTSATPFQPFTEKDSGAGNVTCAYQSITMQPPYQNKSFDELRVEDYMQNRRFPQNNSFGTNNTSFGNFGANNNTTAARPSLFGTTTNTTTTPGFGASNANSTGFGASSSTGFGANNASSGGLFGAKPGTNSLFGGTSNNSTGFGSNQPATGSSLFGGNNNNAASTTTPGFGGGFGNTNTSAGGLFGNTNSAAKPGLFGTATNNTTTTPAFGAGFGNNTNTATTQGGLFGNNQNAGAFGANNNNAGGGLFGNTNNAAKTTGGLFAAPANNAGGGLFGANNNATNNSFGAANPGNSLFGGNNNNTAANTGGLFGAPKAASGGLFGGNNAANTGGGLFGSTNNTNNAGGGLFGATNNSNSLFGNNQAKPADGLFGASNNNSNSLFGNNNNASGSLFGNNNNAAGNMFGSQQPANNSLFSSAGPQQNQLTASLTGDPYGNSQLFSSLVAPGAPVGPLATPLSGARPPPKARASLLASVRGNGASPLLSASSTLTPRGKPGYGFSYSNYNSPLSTTPVLTPGASSLLRPAGSLGSSRLAKSFSTSNLRGELGEGQSLLRAPGPGGSLLLGSGSLGSGSVRRLKIDRTLRTDLFGDSTPKKIDTAKENDKEPELRKRVSFDKSAEKDSTPVAKPSAENALVVREDDAASTPKQPEMTQNSNTTLTTVPEEHADKTQSPRRHEAGDYFTTPPLKQLKAMSRSQLSDIKSFTVGRQGVGKIEFGRDGKVDLSSVVLDDICGKIVQLKPRSATVYEDDSDKPAVGKGLNLPSTIYLEQSWPRSSRQSTTGQKTSQKEIDRHKTRLQRVAGTKFLDYNDETGVWSFTVEHFTTYELDDDEETTMHDATEEDLAAKGHAEALFDSERTEPDSPELGEQDDTFQFKIARRSQQSNIGLPGGFDDSMAPNAFDHDDAAADEMQEDEFAPVDGLGDAMIDPFLDAADDLGKEGSHYIEEDITEEENGLPGSFHAEPDALKSILKPAATSETQTFPVESLADFAWEDQLARTLSPKKRDRQALKSAQAVPIALPQADSDILRKSLLTRSQLGTKAVNKAAPSTQPQSEAFKTSMDIMRSLWADDKQAASNPRLGQTSKHDAAFHNSFKPTFTKSEALVIAGPANARRQSSDITVPLKPSNTDQRDIQLVQTASKTDHNLLNLIEVQQLDDNTVIEIDDMDIDEDDEDEDEGPVMPTAMTSNRAILKAFADVVEASDEISRREKHIWELCSVLFDPLEVCASSLIRGMEDAAVDEFSNQIRKDAFLELWTGLFSAAVDAQMQRSSSVEHKAIVALSAGNVSGASDLLLEAGNPRLAIQVAQLPGSEANRDIMRQQIEVWIERKDWSEFSDGQRALYSLLAGSTCTVSGVKGAAEDKVSSFCISEKFGLTWQQSLALKVRYAGHETFAESITAYVTDVESGAELVKPKPLHANNGGDEDSMLSLLRLVTENGADAQSMLDPAIISENALHNRLTWQLATLLAGRGLLQPSDEQMDSLTMNLAAELEGAELHMEALWVLLHLNENKSRYSAIKATLERNCRWISVPISGGTTSDFAYVTETLLIPASMLWTARALEAGGQRHGALQQCQYLLRAGNSDTYQEAHQILCQKVGPQAVIEQHYEPLQQLVKQFQDIGPVHFDDWSTGGLVYVMLSELMSLAPAKTHSKDAEALLKKLAQSLEAQQEQGEQGLSLEERVARIEMRKMVKEGLKQFDNASKWHSGLELGSARHNKGVAMLEQYMKALGQVH